LQGDASHATRQVKQLVDTFERCAMITAPAASVVISL
jgi:hypothetical protein